MDAITEAEFRSDMREAIKVIRALEQSKGSEQHQEAAQILSDMTKNFPVAPMVLTAVMLLARYAQASPNVQAFSLAIQVMLMRVVAPDATPNFDDFDVETFESDELAPRPKGVTLQ